MFYVKLKQTDKMQTIFMCLMECCQYSIYSKKYKLNGACVRSSYI